LDSIIDPDADKPLRIPEGAESLDSGILSEGGATFSHTFETEGVYGYYCMPHEGMDVVGSVVIGSPDPAGDEPGLSSPS
jgi:plastocyanin